MRRLTTLVGEGCQKSRHHHYLALLCFIIIIIWIIGNTLWEPDILCNKPTSQMMFDMLFSFDTKLVATLVGNNTTSYVCLNQSIGWVLPLLTHNISADFKTYSENWIGYTPLLRELLTEIAHKHPHTLNPLLRRLAICYETEHSLVLPGGQDLPRNTPMGKVPSIYDPQQMYTVRMWDCELSQYDIVVEYSNTNIMNFALSEIYLQSFIDKMVYVPPIEYDYEPFQPTRDLTPFTTYNHPTRSRRQTILSSLWNQHGILTVNYKGIRHREDMMALYDSKAILINIHQTPHHHTMEELRLLPALLRGLVIVSEETPLIKYVPYSDFIIWSSLEDLHTKIADAITNYDLYFERFFGPNSTLPCILLQMRQTAYNSLEKRLLYLVADAPLDGI